MSDRGGAPDALVAGGLAVAAAAVFGSLYAHWYRLEAGSAVVFGAIDRLPTQRTASLGPVELAPAVGAYLAIAGLASMLVALLLALLWH